MSAKARYLARRAEMAAQQGRSALLEAAQAATLARRQAQRAENERIEQAWHEKFEKQERRYYAEPTLDRVGASGSGLTPRTLREIGFAVGQMGRRG